MREGSIQEQSYYYPLDDIKEYMLTLPLVDDLEYRQVSISDKVVVMTHDDILEEDMYIYEGEEGISSTWFLMPGDRKNYNVDIQLHFDKSLNITLSQQMEQYIVRPMFNRNHRLLWRSDNFDFPLLAMNGIKVDSSRIGGKPYIPIINSMLLPIVELPITINDKPKDNKALYQIGNSRLYFASGYTPITVLAHPYEICDKYNLESCYKECLEYADVYGYDIINISQFMERYGT